MEPLSSVVKNSITRRLLGMLLCPQSSDSGICQRDLAMEDSILIAL